MAATAIDVNHIEVKFGEDVDRASAEDGDNYAIVEGPALASILGARPSAPGDPLPIVSLVLESDQRTALRAIQPREVVLEP